MKKNLRAILFALLIIPFTKTSGQFVDIPDSNFRFFLKTKYSNAFNEFNQIDTTNFSVISEDSLNVAELSISNLEGLEYFKSLNYLDISSNHLNSIQPNLLPNKLNYLNCSSCDLTTLPRLPDSLIFLNCYNNKISLLPNLPNKLITLNCSFNEINEIPSLPTMLETLDCSNNYPLVNLPILPSNLKYLSCFEDQITLLPTLPNTLEYLNCSYNKLNSLPTLPNSLKYINSAGNNL